MENVQLEGLTGEQLNYLKGNIDTVALVLENNMKHQNNPLYKEASKIWQDTQTEQINKGAGKYPEPLNPDNYSLDELLQHAMQENVDQVHYLVAMKKKAEAMEAELELGRRSNNAVMQLLQEYKNETRDLLDIAREIISYGRVLESALTRLNK